MSSNDFLEIQIRDMHIMARWKVALFEGFLKKSFEIGLIVVFINSSQ